MCWPASAEFNVNHISEDDHMPLNAQNEFIAKYSVSSSRYTYMDHATVLHIFSQRGMFKNEERIKADRKKEERKSKTAK